MTEPAHEGDLDLFRFFANQETRRVLEALLERPMRQKDLCALFEVTQQAMGPVIAQLERAGLVYRHTPRGELRLPRFQQTAQLLELEATLVEEIQEDKAKRARKRRRRVQKRRMSGGGEQGSRANHSA